MTKVSLIAAFLILATPALAADKPDLSTPEKAARAFFDALKSGDADAVKRTVAPKRVERLGEGFAQWQKLWASYTALSIDGADNLADDPDGQKRAKVRVTYRRPNGTEFKNSVAMSKVGDEWRMDEN
ncbi:MAG: DUF4878 domain-containing protein [Phycisphaerae bacterium]|nr:DUF4878 domain-containing protein [Tepidisphaeraceae bacterium]